MWGTDVWGGFVWGDPTAVPSLSPLGLIVLLACLFTVGTLMLRRRGARWALSVLGVTVLHIGRNCGNVFTAHRGGRRGSWTG